MRRKFVGLISALVLALTFAVPASGGVLSPEDPCAGAPYAVLYGGASGTEGVFEVCFGTNYTYLSFSNGSQNCAGGILDDSSDWDNCFTSVKVVSGSGLGNYRFCVYSQNSWGGNYRKINAGQWGFTGFQWSQIYYAGGANINDTISSTKWCLI